MSLVRVLPDHVVNQIAAGEVVERPASVVKELMENALDAGATTITVQLRDGGKQRIRVLDDGRGMDREDAMMCLERHATSKITHAEDLEAVTSFGFRGEALPSIASVSKFSILTRPADAEVGVRVCVEGGTLTSARAAGCAPGTEIDVKDLFFNIPARRKFLRTRPTELAHCQEAVVRQALIQPSVRFKLVHEGRNLLVVDATEARSRARQILGRDAQQLREVQFDRDGLVMSGLVSPVALQRPAGKSLYLFVNGRYVRDSVLRRGIQEAFQDRILRGRTPLVILNVEVPPGGVDVNVHPAKTEVRFRDPRGVQQILCDGLRRALRAQGPPAPIATRHSRISQAEAPQLPLTVAGIRPHPDDDPEFIAAPTAITEVPDVAPSPTITPSPLRSMPARALLSDEEPITAPTQEAAPEIDDEAPPSFAEDPQSTRALRAIGPYGQRWILCEGDNELVIVDHVLGDTLLSERRVRRDGRPQRLLIPARERLRPDQVTRLLARSDDLGNLGLEIVQMSPTELALRTVPDVLPRLHHDGLLAKLADAAPDTLARVLAESQTLSPVPDVRALRSMLASLEELGLDAIIGRIPTSELLRIAR